MHIIFRKYVTIRILDVYRKGIYLYIHMYTHRHTAASRTPRTPTVANLETQTMLQMMQQQLQQQQQFLWLESVFFPQKVIYFLFQKGWDSFRKVLARLTCSFIYFWILRTFVLNAIKRKDCETRLVWNENEIFTLRRRRDEQIGNINHRNWLQVCTCLGVTWYQLHLFLESFPAFEYVDVCEN